MPHYKRSKFTLYVIEHNNFTKSYVYVCVFVRKDLMCDQLLERKSWGVNA